MPPSLDYSKWDKLEISDDEFEGTGPPPPPEPEDGPAPRFENQLDARREAIRVEVEAALTKNDDSRGGRDDRALVAYFVAAQHRDDGATDNRTRHTLIIDLLAKREVLTNEKTTVALCGVARDALDAKEELRGKIAIEAINTIEAARRYNGALALFEAICAPADDRSKALLKAYAAHTFGELRLKRFVFEKVDSADMRTAMLEHEQEVLKDIDPIPEPRPPPPRRCGGWLPWICLMTVVGVGARQGATHLPRLLAVPALLEGDGDGFGEVEVGGGAQTTTADAFPDAAAAPPEGAAAVAVAAYAPPPDFPGVSLGVGDRVAVIDWDAGASPRGDPYAKVRTADGAEGFAPRTALKREGAAAAAAAFPDFPDL